ncbi:MAG: Fe-S oxidoreductase [Oscillospiraceae bacterium]|nr:Fe-S oxidoreductase [Oscillospiraceae bacterium]
MKKLGFGLMRLPLLDRKDPKSIDMELLKKMVDTFIARGFTYFDTAWMYCGFSSEKATKEALTSRYPRESYTLATKLHAEYFDSVESREAMFGKQLENTGVDYFDYYLLHDVNEKHLEVYDSLDCFTWLAEKKAQGLVRHMGFSFHDSPELLDRLLTEHPDIEFVQLQINYLDWESEKVQSRRCYETAVKHGKKVIVMEPVKGGILAQVPAEAAEMFAGRNPAATAASWAVRFAASLENVMVVLSGMSDMAQVLDNTATMTAMEPLNSGERDMLLKAVEIIRSHIEIPCTACSYCTEGCPMGIPIPGYFSLYNQARQGRGSFSAYEKLSEGAGLASACVGCGQCEGVCPQHLPIRENLKKIAEYFED